MHNQLVLALVGLDMCGHWFQKYFWSTLGERGTLSPLYQLLERCCHKMTVESCINCWLSQVDTSTHVFNAVIRVDALGSKPYLGIHWRSPALFFFFSAKLMIPKHLFLILSTYCTGYSIFFFFLKIDPDI